MNDYQKHLATNASIIRDRLAKCADGKALSIYKNVQVRRVTRVSADNKIEVLVGANWRSAFVSPTGIRHLMVKS